MLSPASFPLPCSAFFLKSHSWGKGCAISFEDEEITPQSQTFLLHMVRRTWCLRKIRNSFRRSNIWKKSYEYRQKSPFLNCWGWGELFAAWEEGIRLVPTLAPLVSSCVRHHYPEALAPTCSFTISPWGDRRWQWFCQRRKREKEGKWKIALIPGSRETHCPSSCRTLVFMSHILDQWGPGFPTDWSPDCKNQRNPEEVPNIDPWPVPERCVFPMGWFPSVKLTGMQCNMLHPNPSNPSCLLKNNSEREFELTAEHPATWGAVGSALTTVTNSRWTLCLHGRSWLHPKQPGPELWLLQRCPCTSQVLQETRLRKLQLKPKIPIM